MAVTVCDRKIISTDKTWYKYAGLSTDTKPTQETMQGGSEFVEMDTAKLYLWDDENGVWLEWT